MTLTLTEKTNTPSKRRHSILDAIGNTPMIRLHRLTRELPQGVEVWVKLESENPGGSGKDRPALQIVLDAFAAGKLNTNKTLIDASTGSIGVGYAMCGAAMGFDVTLVIPEGVEKNGCAQMTTAEILGANIIRVPGGIDTAREYAKEKADQNGDEFYYANQFENPSNARAHRLSTSLEIYTQTEEKITHFISSVGTGGTLAGISEGLHDQNPAIQIIACQPKEATGHESMQKKSSMRCTPDLVYEFSLEEAATMARRLAEEEGIPGGIVSGMNLCGAFKLAHTLESGLIVALISDHADFTSNADFKSSRTR